MALDEHRAILSRPDRAARRPFSKTEAKTAMANERGKGSSEGPEPDHTMLQPGAGQPSPAGRENDIEPTIVQGGATGGRQRDPVDATIRQPDRGEKGTPDHGSKGGDEEIVPSGKARVFAGRFEITEKLGEGGMGVVYRARDREIEGREIALKVLRPRFSRNPKFRELFFREIHAAQGFVSENVVQVRDTGKASDGTLFLTMDLVDGEPLDQVLARESALNERHALEVARQTLLALASGHEQGFVHRDVKPSNVMLARRVPKTDENPFGVGVRVLDFGIAGLSAQVEEGQIVGTPRYMSPEQVQGQRLDGRSDLFAVGILLYEMLSGSRPFEGDTPEECRTSILETNVVPMITELEHLSEPIRKILRTALQKNRDKRFQSAADFIRAIEKSRAFREKRGTPAWVSAMLFCSLTAVGGGGWLIWDQRKEYDKLERDYGGIQGNHAQEMDRLRAEHQHALDSVRGSLEQMRSERDTAIAAKETAMLDASRRSDDYARELENRRVLADELTQVQNRLRETEKQLNAIGRKELPEVAAARFIDHVVRLIDGGHAQEALNYLESRRRNGVVDIAVGEGAAHVDHLLAAGAALDLAAKALLSSGDGAPNTELPTQEVRNQAFDDYQRGARHLQQAHASANAFVLESVKWIGEKAELGSEGPIDRVADLRRILAAFDARAELVKERIAGLKRELEDIVARERAELLKTTFQDNPAPVIQHMRAYSDDVAELIGLVDRLGAKTEEHCVSNGRFRLQRAMALHSVQQWGEYLVDDGAKITGKGADTLRWLWAARLWYEGQSLAGPKFAFLDGVPRITETTPHANWRQQLQVQRALGKTIDSFLTEGQGVAIYRQRSSGDQRLDWYHEMLQPEAGTPGSWEIVRKRVDEEGKFARAQSIRVSLRNGVFSIADVPTLDVRGIGDHLTVAHWQPSLVAALPDQPWSRGINHVSFARGIAEGLPCLVVAAGNTRFWFAPGYGLVRQEIDGVFEREMCYSARVR